MTTLQEQFEKDFPDKSVRKIDAFYKYKDSNFTNYDLDLREYVSLDYLNLVNDQITSVILSQCKELTKINIIENNLTSVDFLNDLPNPEKLELLWAHTNKIQPTDISIFSRFINLTSLKIGTMGEFCSIRLKKGKRNQFYGSFKSWKNLTKLTSICIEATDVNEGLEYLPIGLISKWKGYENSKIECSPRDANAKCKAIQDELRPFNYDLEAWQLANPEKMFKASPELSFINEGNKGKWLQLLKNKLEESQKELSEIDREKVKRIARLENKISELEKAKATISQQTQTDLTMEQIKQWERESQKKTLYQNFVDKYSKK